MSSQIRKFSFFAKAFYRVQVPTHWRSIFIACVEILTSWSDAQAKHGDTLSIYQPQNTKSNKTCRVSVRTELKTKDIKKKKERKGKERKTLQYPVIFDHLQDHSGWVGVRRGQPSCQKHLVQNGGLTHSNSSL